MLTDWTGRGLLERWILTHWIAIYPLDSVITTLEQLGPDW